MTDYVIRYKRQWIPILWTQRSIRTLYENAGDVADIQWDESKTYVMNSDWSTKSDIEKSVIESDMFWPMFKVLRIPIGKRISSRDLENFKGEAHNSYFISWLSSEYTETDFSESDLEIEERPLTEKEIKIRQWIDKNLPTFKSLYRKFNGSNSTTTDWGDQRGDTCDLADNGKSADKWDLILNKVERKLDEIQDWKRYWTSRRFIDWGDRTGYEDQIHWTDSITSSSSQSSSKIRIKSSS